MIDSIIAKLIIAALLAVVLGFSLFGVPDALEPMQTVSADGIENYREAQSSMDVNRSLLPGEDFPERFPTVDADYHYREYYNQYSLSPDTERSIVVCRYEPEVYGQAKAYCLTNMELSDENRKEYRGCVFAENLRMTDQRTWDIWFNYLGWNDETHCLIFLGFHENSETEGYAEDQRLISDDWGAFLEKHFSEFYDFSE